MKIGFLYESQNSLPAEASWYEGTFPFAALKDDNRRFMYNPKTNTFVIGKLDPLSGAGVDSSHEKEFKESGAPGSRHDYPLSGWIGVGGQYPHGVIHFAPPMITDNNPQVLAAGEAIIQAFKASGATSSTVLRNFLKMGEQRLGMVSETFIMRREKKAALNEALLEPTPQVLDLYTKFLKNKWAERSKERYLKWEDDTSNWNPPANLEGACKFASLFAQQLFGGELRGNYHHQYLVLPNGKTIDPVPVPELDDPNYHDEDFWMNKEHKESLQSCVPRVKEWVKEFTALTEAKKGPKKGVDKGSQKREKIGFATDDPSKYVGKWEEYTEPQGINSPAGKKMTKTESALSGIKMYHGQPRPADGQIKNFELNHPKDGIYFTSDPDYAANYAVEFRAQDRDPDVDSFAKTGVIYPVYLDIKNPLILSGEDEEAVGLYTQRGFDREEVMSRGHDGIVLKYADGEIEAQVFDPKQIKSAIGESFNSYPNFTEMSPEYAQKIVKSSAGEIVYATVFNVDDTKYIAYAEKESQYPGLYAFSFNTMGSLGTSPEFFEPTGKRTPLKVISGAIKALTNFATKYKPQAINIQGSNPHQEDLYDKLISKVKIPGYKVDRRSRYAMEGIVLVRESGVNEGNSMGPEFSRGGNNSSTGSGAVPIIVQPPDLPRSLRGKKKYTGSKSPIAKVRSTVRKSTKNKVRKANSPVTEVFDDPTNAFPYEEDGGMYEIDAGIDNLQIIVGFEDIRNYNSQLKPGVNAGMVTIDEGGMNLGVEPAKIGMRGSDTIKLFNSLMNITREYVSKNDPDRIYFVAVKPMEGIYQRLIRKFVDVSQWNITVIKDVPIPMIGTSLNAYMLEKKNLVAEMVRLPMNQSMNNDYEVKNGEDVVGKAKVTDGVIEEFMVNVGEDSPSDFRGHVMSSMMGTITRDADGLNTNMSMQIEDQDDTEMKRFLERFGFKHVGQGIFKRVAGAITPPSVIY